MLFYKMQISYTMHYQDLKIVKKDIEDWIKDFLSVSNPTFNNLPPCPYARKAWSNDKVVVLSESINILKIKTILKDNDVIIYAFDPSIINQEELWQLAKNINDTEDDIVALDDHPENEEKVQDQIMNQGSYALLFVQDRQKLKEARISLHNLGYYNMWSPSYLEEVLSI